MDACRMPMLLLAGTTNRLPSLLPFFDQILWPRGASILLEKEKAFRPDWKNNWLSKTKNDIWRIYSDSAEPLYVITYVAKFRTFAVKKSEAK
jgi:hypothetical protein